jgi:hypothetical protein
MFNVALLAAALSPESSPMLGIGSQRVRSPFRPCSSGNDHDPRPLSDESKRQLAAAEERRQRRAAKRASDPKAVR